MAAGDGFGERLLDGLDRLGRRVSERSDPSAPALGERAWWWVGGLGPRSALVGADDLGGRMLDRLGDFGTRVLDRLGLGTADRPVNRLSRSTLVVAGACAVLLVMAVWIAFGNTTQDTAWLTQPDDAPAAAAPAPQAATAGTAAVAARTTSAQASAAAPVRHVKLVVDAPPLGGLKGPDGQVHDAFVPANFTIKAGVTYQVTVLNYDATPHTWTAPALGANATILSGSASSPSRTTFDIRSAKPGIFEWYCATPCDSYSMGHTGYMRGDVTAVA